MDVNWLVGNYSSIADKLVSRHMDLIGKLIESIISFVLISRFTSF